MGILKDCIDNKKSFKYSNMVYETSRKIFTSEFREIRSKNENFIKLCLNPDLSKEITITTSQKI